ncbi:MAG: FAD-dependent oxidoreductase [bacterium]
MQKRIVIIGSNFAGYTAAMKLQEELKGEHAITVISKSPDFLFMPSLIWVPFGLREREQITIPLEPLYEKKGIRFVLETVDRIDLAQRTVHTEKGFYGYDYLVIATGPELAYDAIPGLGPIDGYTQSIFSWEHAERTQQAFEELLRDPGPVVIGAVQGASCFGAAYEFLFNTAHQLKKHKLLDKAPLTYVTAEPFLAHFGIGGFGNGTKMTDWFFRNLHITAELDAEFQEITPDEMLLTDGRRIPYKFAMLAPSFRGVKPVRELTEITNKGGFVKVGRDYATEQYPEVYAAGVAVAMDPPDVTKVPCGVPKTGYLSEEMAKVVAHNIVADITGGKKMELPPQYIDAKCVLDAGNTGIIMLADHFLEPRQHAWLIPGPEAHWAKLAFEKYFMTTHRMGHV